MKSGYRITPPNMNNGAHTTAGIKPNSDNTDTGTIIPANILPTVCVLLLNKFLWSRVTNKYAYMPYMKNIVFEMEPETAPIVSASKTVSKTLL